MADIPQTKRLLARVERRLRLAAVARAAGVALLVLAGLFAGGLLTARLSGSIPDVFTLEAMAVLPALAALLGFAFHRRPKSADVARAVDEYAGTKDLFLTTALLERSPGEFQPLVARDAEARAPRIRPVEVVGWHWEQPLLRAGIAAALLFAGVFFLPQFDPFGKVAEANEAEAKAAKLAEARKATEARRAQLIKEKEDDVETKQVEKSIDELKMALNKMKPKARSQNFDKIQERQIELGKNWKKLSDQMLKDLMAQKPVSQQFGGNDQELLQKWTKDLQNGDNSGLHKEMEELKEDIERLTKTEDPLEKQEIMQKLRKRLESLSELAEKKVNSKPLAAALERAREQLEMAKSEGLSTEALESLKESLDLTDAELKQIAQSAKELKELEKALKVCQMAKKLNEQDELDGAAAGSCKTLGDYEKLYEQLLAGQMGEGEGFGDQGIGEGGIAPEDDSTKSDFKTEKSETQITAGKVLLTLKSKGQGDENAAELSYKEAIRNVKQGTSEAILQERVPPGYHEGIKKYFDSLEAAPRPQRAAEEEE